MAEKYSKGPYRQTGENKMTLTIEQRIAQAETALAEGRIIQGFWRRRGDDGRELVCALSAFGPDINSSLDCPADLMPSWLAKLVPTLDDSIAADDVPWFMGELVSRAKRWSTFDAAAWERVRTGFLIRTVQIAVDEAANAHAENPPAYWQQVLDATKAVQDALGGNGNLAVARAEVRYAYAVTDPAVYVTEAVVYAADAAVYAAAYAANAAARSAINAADAAAEAVARKIAEALFSMIDIEVMLTEKQKDTTS